MKQKFLYYGFIVFFLTGCATTSPKKSSDQSQETTLQNLAVQMQKNPEAQSAVESVSQTLKGQNVNIKYCPVDGKRFSAAMEQCPEHHVPLKLLE